LKIHHGKIKSNYNVLCQSKNDDFLTSSLTISNPSIYSWIFVVVFVCLFAYFVFWHFCFVLVLAVLVWQEGREQEERLMNAQ
jgi:hypothetical protein